MEMKRKLIISLAAILGTLLVLGLAVFVLLPRIVESEAVKKRVIAAISREVEGTVGFGLLRISWFPRPAVLIEELTVIMPGRAAVNVSKITAVPEILPLLRGKVNLAKLTLARPVGKILLPEKWDPAKALKRDKRRETPQVPILPDQDMTMEITRGRLDMVRGTRILYSFRDVRARIRQAGGKLYSQLTCHSNLWQRLDLNGRFDLDERSGRGTLEIKGFTPHELGRISLPGSRTILVDSLMNLDLSVEAAGPEKFTVKWQGELPKAMLSGAEGEYTLKAPVLNGSLSRSGRQMTLTLTRAVLAQPRFTASGSVVLTTGAENETRHLALDITGRDVDVPSTRQALLFLLGREKVIARTFEVVRKGSVPRIRFQTAGGSGEEIKDNLAITGRMQAGEILVPQGELYLTEVAGQVKIEGEVLSGRDLEARLGDTTAEDGTLELGLSDDQEVFRLELLLDADLSQVPAILEKYVSNERVEAELTRLEEVAGRGTGRLALGDTKKDIQAVVDVDRFELKARYGRLPFPIAIDGESFHYGPERIRAGGLSARMGNSQIRRGEIAVATREPYSASLLLPAAAGPGEGRVAAELSLDELVPWLRSFDPLARRLAPVSGLDGMLRIAGLELDGPLLTPGKWDYSASGTLENVEVNADVLPAPLTVSTAAYRLTRDGVSLNRSDFRLLDSRLKGAVSLEGYRQGDEKVAGTLEGEVGNDLLSWIWERSRLPARYRPEGPIRVLESDLRYSGENRFGIEGRFAFAENLEVGLSLAAAPGDFNIHRLTVLDGASDASLAIRLKPEALSLSFAGNLSGTAIEKIFVNDRLFAGRISGRFQSILNLQNIGASSVSGSLEGENVQAPLLIELPIGIERFQIEASDQLIQIEESTLKWQDKLLALQGKFMFSADAMVFDLDLGTQILSWEQIGELAAAFAPSKGDASSGTEKGAPETALPIQGTLNLSIGNFLYQDFLWHPLEASLFLEDGNRIRVAVQKANLCGIATPGEITIRWPQVSLEFQALAQSNFLDPTLYCLAGQENLAIGEFSIDAKVTADAQARDLLDELNGQIIFSAGEGRIYRFTLLSRIFSLLNISELFQGDLPDLGKEGFAYSSMNAKARVSDGVLRFEEAVIDGEDMEIACHGTIDLQTMEMNLTVLVAPLKTIDMILKRIPLIRNIFEGTLVSIPVRVSGPVQDPQVVPLSPSAVGSEILGIMKRTLELPIEIIQPLVPDETGPGSPNQENPQPDGG